MGGKSRNWQRRWPLSGIGFLVQSSSRTRACSRPALLSSFALLLMQGRGRWQLPGSRDDLRPRFGQQSAAWEDLSGEQGGYSSQASTHDATQPAFRWLARRPFAPTTSDMFGGQGLAQWLLALFFLCLTAYTHRPELGHGHRQPESLHATGLHHFAVMPAPQAALEILKAGFASLVRIPYQLTSASSGSRSVSTAQADS